MVKLVNWTIIVLAIYALACAPAMASDQDFGIGIWVNEEGSDQWEAVIMGISNDVQAHPWSINRNPNAKVHVVLDGGLTLETRSHQNPNWVFGGSIACDDYSRNYHLRYGFIDSSIGGPWDLAPFEPTMTLVQPDGSGNSFSIAREWGSTDLYMGGDFGFTVDFQSPTVPEPGSLLALGTGLTALVGFGLRRRR